MKLGLESFSVRNSGLDPVGVIELAADLGLQGVLFEDSPFRSFQDDELARIRNTAEEKGLYIEFGMGSIFHWHPMSEKGRKLLGEAGYDVDVSEAQIVIHHLDIAEGYVAIVGDNVFPGHAVTYRDGWAGRSVSVLSVGVFLNVDGWLCAEVVTGV